MATNFKTWQKIQIGRYGEGSLIRADLQKKWIAIGHVADYTLDRIAYWHVGTWVDLALVSVAELGFSAPAEYQDIVDAAIRQGLSICPGEVGAEICLQCEGMPPKDREDDKGLYIAMNAIKSNLGFFNIYVLIAEKLQMSRAHPQDKFNPQVRFVFLKSNR